MGMTGFAQPTMRLFRFGRHVRVRCKEMGTSFKNNARKYRVATGWSEEDRTYIARIEALNVAANGETAKDATNGAYAVAEGVLKEYAARKKAAPPVGHVGKNSKAHRFVDRIVIQGRRYVVLPEADYELLAGPRNKAAEYVAATLGRALRAARKHAQLTENELARMVSKTSATVREAETGKVPVSEAYVLSVLRACGLPDDWKPAPRKK